MRRAAEIGPSTSALVEIIMRERRHPEQGFRASIGIIRLAKGYSRERFRMTFQSRFGPDEWLKPYTDETVKSLASSGVKSMAIVQLISVPPCRKSKNVYTGFILQ